MVFLASAFLVWRKSRIGFIVGIVMSVIFIFVFSSDIVSGLQNPASTANFLPVVTILPALVAGVVYSIVGFRMAWMKWSTRQPRMIPFSSLVAFLTVGFVVGALVVGAFAGGTEASLLAGAGKGANVVMVSGAGNQGNPGGYFSPENYTVTVGSTVVWVNQDNVAHTVTSTSVPKGAASFDSGDINPGQEYSVTFTTPGVYYYHCSIHPWMTGTINVTG